MKDANYAQRLAYLIGFLDMLSVGLFIPLFPQYARKIGISPVNIGLFGSIYGCLQFFSSPIIGGWSDQSGKVKVLSKCLLLSAVGYYILGAYQIVWVILASRIVAGFFKHTQSLVKAYLTDLAPNADHHRVFGYQSSISNLGFIIGPPLGGMIVESDNGYQFATYVGASLIVVQAILTYFFLEDPSLTKTDHKLKEKNGDIWSNLKAILAQPSLRDVFLIQFFISASSLLFRENASLLLHVRYATSARSIGFMISFANFVSSVSGFFVAKLANWYGNDDSRLLLHCTYVHVFAVVASTFAPAFWMYNICLVPYKLAQAVSRVAIMNLLVLSSDGVASGELMGSSQSILAVSRIVMPFLCGLMQEISVFVPGILAAILGVMTIPSIHQSKKRVKQH